VRELTLTTLPNVSNARLPVSYERAREALAKCSRVDECAEWAAKAEAIASYARQADDDTLMNTAQRIKARAIRRCGELLKEIPAAKGQRSDLQPRGGAPPKSNGHANGARQPSLPIPMSPRTEVARAAGLSADQQKQAMRVAALPAKTFEAAVEALKPATVTELAERGKRPSTAHLKGRDPKEYAASTRAQGALREFVERTQDVSPKLAVRGSVPHEHAKMAANARRAVAWLTQFQSELEKTR